MGAKESKEGSEVALEHTALSEACEKKVREVFDNFDIDHSHVIDKNEALKHFKGGFAKISMKELFSTVDVNNDGSITIEEWLTFWRVVKGVGHSEEDIMEELENILTGGSWVGFDNLPKKYKHASHDGKHPE